MHRLDVGSVLSRALKTYGTYWKPLLLIALAVHLPSAFMVASIMSRRGAEGGLAGAFGALLLVPIAMIAGMLVTGMYVLLVEDVRDGRMDRNVSEYFSATLPKIGGLLVTALLTGLGCMLGFILLIIPGVIFAIWWSVSSVVVMVENTSGTAALGRSKAIISGNTGNVFVVLLVAGILGAIVSGVAGFALGSALGPPDAFAHLFVKQLAGVIAAPFTGILPALMYFDLAGESAPSTDLS